MRNDLWHFVRFNPAIRHVQVISDVGSGFQPR